MKQGWKYGTLEDAVKKGSSNISLNKIKDDNGEYPVFSAKGFAKNVSFFQQEQEYIAIIKDGAGIGRVGRYPAKSSVVATMQYLIPKDGFDIGFVEYFLRGIDFEKHRSGSTIPHVYFKDYKSEAFPLIPLPEQQRIVEILDKAFVAIDKAKQNAEQNLRNAKEVFESYLQTTFDNGKLKVESGKWEKKTLGEVCSLITDGKHGNCENEANSGYYFLSAKDIRNNTLLFDNGRQITQKDFLETHQRTDLKPGDICMINTGATIGRISFAPRDDRTYKTTFQKSVAVIKPVKTHINNHYCRYLLVSDVKKLVKVSSGTAVPNLLLGDLRKHKIYLPKTIQEQNQIVKKLDKLSAETKKLEIIYQQKIDDSELLKKSVLQKAFEEGL